MTWHWAADSEARWAAKVADNVHVPSLLVLLFALARFDESELLVRQRECVCVCCVWGST